MTTTANPGLPFCRKNIQGLPADHCAVFDKLVYTYRIFREHQGHFRIQTSEGVPQKVFRTLKDLIYTFEKPDQGLVINLRYPVKKPQDSQRRWRLKSGNDTIYDEIDDSEYVSVLP
ncbi:SH2 domain-containing protein 1B isoform X2 [Pogoniulus pusillus]|uniref:SH2 domain-containing protein 1B isoform X2 n=1 Tax=Pogoniulus pusillus TaxID=488313 RepID=UPI0030B98119